MPNISSSHCFPPPPLQNGTLTLGASSLSLGSSKALSADLPVLCLFFCSPRGLSVATQILRTLGSSRILTPNNSRPPRTRCSPPRMARTPSPTFGRRFVFFFASPLPKHSYLRVLVRQYHLSRGNDVGMSSFRGKEGPAWSTAFDLDRRSLSL